MKMDWKKFAQIAQMVGPMVLTLVNPALGPIAGKITDAIAEAEKVQGATGKQKAEHVKNIVKSGIESANVAGANLDVPAIDASIQDGIDAVVSATNIIATKGKVQPIKET